MSRNFEENKQEHDTGWALVVLHDGSGYMPPTSDMLPENEKGKAKILSREEVKSLSERLNFTIE